MLSVATNSRCEKLEVFQELYEFVIAHMLHDSRARVMKSRHKVDGVRAMLVPGHGSIYCGFKKKEKESTGQFDVATLVVPIMHLA